MIDVLQIEQRLAEHQAKVARVNRDGWWRYAGPGRRVRHKSPRLTPVIRLGTFRIPRGVGECPSVSDPQRQLS
jgi:hypothetical protein